MTPQPIDTVEWVDPSTLTANDYNPNIVAPRERALLRCSLLEDGWTQPIVADPDGEIIDGFHRWGIAMKDAEVAAMTDGLVPVVRLRPADEAHQRMSTIRHNRARGSHFVRRMAHIVNELLAHGLTSEEIQRRLGMDDVEVERLAAYGKMTDRGSAEEFGREWRPYFDDGSRDQASA